MNRLQPCQVLCNIAEGFWQSAVAGNNTASGLGLFLAKKTMGAIFDDFKNVHLWRCQPVMSPVFDCVARLGCVSAGALI